jgi:hypothetical protein
VGKLCQGAGKRRGRDRRIDEPSRPRPGPNWSMPDGC